MHHQPVTDEMMAAEAEAAQETLNAGLVYAKTLLRHGRPELEIVNAAAEWKADVILICARAEYGEPPHIGHDRSGTLRVLCWIMRPARCCCYVHWLANNSR